MDIQQLKEWDRRHVWHAFTQMQDYEPFIFDRGAGCTLYDVDGNAYLDGVSSLWCNVHGHRHPTIDQAIRDQLDRVAHTTSLGCSNPTTIQLARKLVELAPAGLEHVFFSDSGATAVEVALKMAFQSWRQRRDPRPEKKLYVAFDDAYHGDTIGSVSVGGVARFHAMFEPLLFECLKLPAPLGESPAEAQPHLDRLESLLRDRHDEIAALVIEPLVQCAAGMRMHAPGYLAGARELTRRYDVLLIADEVAVGFGRTGTLFACEQEAVAPDFLCLGKGLTGGYLPVAATLATTEIWDSFLGRYDELKTFFHGHTFGGNPLGCAAALGALRVFEEERTLDHLPEKIERLTEHLARIAEQPHVGAVRQRGLIAGVEIVADKPTGEPFDWRERRGHAACRHALDHGVWLRPLGDVVVIMPPLAMSMEELDKVCRAAEAGVRAATEFSLAEPR